MIEKSYKSSKVPKHDSQNQTRSHMPERDEITYALREIDLSLKKLHYIGTVIFNQIYLINQC